MGYPLGSIGRFMTPDFFSIREEWTVSQTLEEIRLHGHDSETLGILYILDDNNKLKFDIKIRELLLLPLETRISAVPHRIPTVLSPTAPVQDAIGKFKLTNRYALPVVDAEGYILGIVTVDDILHLVDSLNTESFHKMGGSNAFDEPYLKTSISGSIKKRAVWLVILFLGELLTATAMGYFEAEIAKAVVLALFIPLIISSGGNSGSQASTLIVRALAIGEVTPANWWNIMKKEFICGLGLGLVLGVLGLLRIAIWANVFDMYGPHWSLLSTTVGLSFIGVVMWGSLTGSLIPLAIKKLGGDPAVSSAPFVATLVDVTGLVIYFGIAAALLKGTVL